MELSYPYNILVPWCLEHPGTDEERYQTLHDKTLVRYRIISSAELLAWMGSDSRWLRLISAQSNQLLPESVRNVATVAKLFIERDQTGLDLTLYDRATMVDVLLQAGVLTVEEKESLYSLARYYISQCDAWNIDIGYGHLKSARELENII